MSPCLLPSFSLTHSLSLSLSLSLCSFVPRGIMVLSAIAITLVSLIDQWSVVSLFLLLYLHSNHAAWNILSWLIVYFSHIFFPFSLSLSHSFFPSIPVIPFFIPIVLFSIQLFIHRKLQPLFFETASCEVLSLSLFSSFFPLWFLSHLLLFWNLSSHGLILFFFASFFLSFFILWLFPISGPICHQMERSQHPFCDLYQVLLIQVQF